MTQFDYEISLDEYSAAQGLYYKACTKSQAFTKPLGWASVGVLFLSVAILQWAADLTHFLLLLTGAWFTYGAISSLPKRLFRKFYLASGLAGRKYRVELDGDGFTVNNDGCTWRVQWPEVLFKGEDNRVFTFGAKGQLFIFGKKYVTGEQQELIRQYAALS